MDYGPTIIPMDNPQAQVIIRASGAFTVFAVGESDQRLRILGPNSSSSRYLKVAPGACNAIEIQTEPDTAIEWELSILPSRRDDVSEPPREIPVGMEKPETLEQMMMRLVETRLAEFADDSGHESFEDADDFDIDDDALPHSPYEMVDMQEDRPFYPDAPNPNASPAEQKPPETSSAAPGDVANSSPDQTP